MSNNTSPFKQLLPYIVNYKLGFIVAVISMLFYAGIDTFFISQLKPFIDKGITNKDTTVLTWAPIVVVAIFILRGLFNFISMYALSWVGSNVVRDIRQRLFNQLINLPVSFHDQNSTGDLISKVTYDTEQIQQATSKSLLVLVREGAFVIGLLGLMFYESWRLSLIFLIITPLIAIIVSYVSKRFRSISRNIQNSMGNVTKGAEQMLVGHKVILGFGGQELESKRFYEINNSNRQQKIKLAATTSLSVSAIQIIASFALATVLYIASFPSMLDTLTPGKFMVIIGAMMMLLRPLKQLTNVNSEFQKGMAATTSVFEVLSQDIEKDTGTKALAVIESDIQFKDVSFTYPTSETAVLKNLNLTLKKGQTLALVGRSGSGKSTISNLLPRYYDIQQGMITINDQPIDHYTLSSLRKNIAVVSQQVVLFNDTIANNIAYGMEGEVSREQVVDAATKAHVMEFVEQLPEGLNSEVGENGVMLSGGQRQRLAIARALLRNSPILILDEATSALDTESERIIQDALNELMKDRTCIVIAHRLSTIESADQILVIEQGQVAEQGTHIELLAKDGIYSALHKMQFGS
ncbi:lipid A export permease/ATP-binding protein MsbA [Flocculibacter collagenilyticus]|uniref:lipid A export permease/ATP-binding protein MsbA n=1 Tax=Flocculibacter collagenilyticus TaxID=2744479 RepID=UPI0018F447A2|nr:lipid A export permease/ATP-binding protein MsbA [Flocculibacter collagenilyticus]